MMREEGGQKEVGELKAIYIGADGPRRDSQSKTEKTSQGVANAKSHEIEEK